MAANDPTFVKGVQFSYSTDGGVTFTTLINMMELGSPGAPTRPKIDKTPLDPVSTRREFGVGLSDPGECTFKQYWKKDRETALKLLDGVQCNWRMTYNDAILLANRSHDDFVGTLYKLTKSPLSKVDDWLILDGSILLSGDIAFTAGAGP